MKDSTTNCPCGRPVKYRRCCGAIHRGAFAPTPEALMRSRYTAYALGKARYIMDTTHPDSPHTRADRKAWREELIDYCHAVRFDGLQVLNTSVSDDGEEGWVSFHATLTQDGQDLSFTEHSHFKKVGKRWLYLAGV